MMIMLAGKMLALVANQVYLSYLDPSSEQLNIYSWAVNIPNNIFQSFGTALASVVIPIFGALLVKGKRKEADRFASNVVCVSSAITLVLVVAGMALSFVLPSFTSFEDKGYTAMALRVMMPVMLFYCLCYIYQGVLQSHDRYRSAALVNLPSGIMIILYTIFLSDRFGVTGLLIVTALGLFMQFAVLIIPAWRAGFKAKPVFDLKDPDLIQAGKMTVPIILGASAYQFNMFFNGTMMTNVAPNSVSLFNFVQNLILSSVMTMVLAITSVMYPTLTKYAASDDTEGFKRTLSTTMGGIVFLLAPLSVGLIVLRTPFLSLISEYGNVTAENVATEAGFLLMYCLCIVFLGLKEITDRAFYSLKTTRISAITGVVIMAVNIVVGFVLSKYTPLGANGIPLAYSIAAISGTMFLIVNLRRRIGRFGFALGETVIKSIVSAAVMGAAVFGVYYLMRDMTLGGVVVSRALRVLLPTGCGVVVYFILSIILRTPPLGAVLNKLKGRAQPSGEEN